MSPKKDKYSKILFGPLQSYSVHSFLFGPLWFYSVHFGPIRSTFVHISPIRSILSTLVIFGPHWSYSVLFSLIWSYSVLLFLFITPALVVISLFILIRSPSVHLGPTQSNLVYLFTIRQYFVHLVHFVPFGPIWSIICVHFSPFWSTLVYFCVLTYKAETCLG